MRRRAPRPRPPCRAFCLHLDDLDRPQAEAAAVRRRTLGIGSASFCFGGAAQPADAEQLICKWPQRLARWAARPTRSFRGCRSRAPRDGTGARSRRRRRSAPSRSAAAPRPARGRSRLLQRAQHVVGDRATCRCERPEATIIASASELLSLRSMKRRPAPCRLQAGPGSVLSGPRRNRARRRKARARRPVLRAREAQTRDSAG